MEGSQNQQDTRQRKWNVLGMKGTRLWGEPMNKGGSSKERKDRPKQIGRNLIFNKQLQQVLGQLDLFGQGVI